MRYPTHATFCYMMSSKILFIIPRQDLDDTNYSPVMLVNILARKCLLVNFWQIFLEFLLCSNVNFGEQFVKYILLVEK
jgi:hypothetical protein